jgi:nitrite reductase (NADH) small subunit
MAFVRAAKASDIPEGKIREVQIGDKPVALANVAGKFHAINGMCLHQGGPLGEGELEGQIVTCPWHGWQFNVTTGEVSPHGGMSVDCYPIEMRGDEIFVDVS